MKCLDIAVFYQLGKPHLMGFLNALISALIARSLIVMLLRALKLEGVGIVADGGTIVATTQEVGNVTITGVEIAEGNTCIKYQVI